MPLPIGEPELATAALPMTLPWMRPWMVPPVEVDELDTLTAWLVPAVGSVIVIVGLLSSLKDRLADPDCSKLACRPLLVKVLVCTVKSEMVAVSCACTVMPRAGLLFDTVMPEMLPVVSVDVPRMLSRIELPPNAVPRLL